MALAFRRFAIAVGQKARQPAISIPIAGIDENIGDAIAEDETGAGDEAKVAGIFLVVAQEEMRAHHAGKRIAIGDTDAGEAERNRGRDEFFRMRTAAQERKIRRDREFGIARLRSGNRRNHPNRPCRNQRGSTVSVV